MLVKHVNPFFLYKLLKAPHEMRTLQTYLKVILLWWLDDSIAWARWTKNEMLKYLIIQTIIRYKMSKRNNIVICNTLVSSPRKQLFFCLLAIFIIYNDKVELQVRNITLITLQLRKMQVKKKVRALIPKEPMRIWEDFIQMEILIFFPYINWKFHSNTKRTRKKRKYTTVPTENETRIT